MVEKQQPNVRGLQELKSVRSCLLECYRSLYFDPFLRHGADSEAASEPDHKVHD